MRPSCQSATPCPWSAAYCSEVNAFLRSPLLSASVARRNASPADSAELGTLAGASADLGAATVGTGAASDAAGTAAAFGDGVPSSDSTGSASSHTASPATPANPMSLDIRIGRLLGSATWVGHGAVQRGTNLLGVFPQIAGGRVVLA